MRVDFFMAYISPNGSTRIIAEELQKQLAGHGHDVTVIDLADMPGQDALVKKLEAAVNPCLMIGSPVYRDMAVPPVMAFIEKLPETSNGWTAPFVTWGLACSGVALWQMGKALKEKGWRLAGAAKVAGPHSMMLLSDKPCGTGHPDKDDTQKIRDLADTLSGKLHELDLNILDYQPADLALEQKVKLEQPWMIIPKSVDEKACLQCGTCAEGCPVGAITLALYPHYSQDCFDCFNCVKNCPENAIQSGFPLEKIEEMILNRVKTIGERPLTQIFTP